MDVFESVLKFKADGDISIEKYESKKSGLQVVLANVDGPLVYGYISFATEAKNDDGLPHTLEHLVFMGSEEYPYKGVLDLLANSCLSSGTNAWTDTDHTCYTLCTAGEEGFFNLLPIYLDHLLNPLLTEQAFITEVHHVNGQGEDGGVVYCEMQGRENTSDSKCHLAMMRHMYPGDNGYKYETGGILKNLRESTTNQKCKAYHSYFYHPSNMCILIVGKIDPENAIQCIAKFESKYLEKKAGKKGNEDNFVRPWQTRVPPLTESCRKTVKFPSDTEDNGAVHIGWRGPSAVKNFHDIIILGVLMDYLTDTAVSPLQREFVQIDDPYCSNVYHSHAENSVSCFYFIFESVPVKKLSAIEGKLFEVLKKIIDGKEPINMKRMDTVIHRAKLNIINSCETSPQNIMASAVIGDFLYGTHVDDLKTRLSVIPLIESLYEKKENFWIKLLEKYFPNGKYVIIIGEPSTALLKEMTESEKKRIEEQKKRLGPDGLKEKEKLLTAAKQLKKPPKEMLNKFKRPSVEKLHFHKVLRITNYIKPDESVNSLFQRLTDIPFRFQVDNLQTNFVTFHVLMNTSTCLQPNSRLYLPLWTELVTQTVIEKKGVVIPYENIVAQLAEDTIRSEAFIGLDGGGASGLFSQMTTLFLKVEVDKFEKGVSWLHDILYNTRFTAERLNVIVKKLLNVIADSKREGYLITSSLSKSLNFSPQCNHWAVNLFRQRAFLRGIEKKLKQSPDAVVKELDELRHKITSFENLTIHVAINEKKLTSAFSGDPVASILDRFVPEKFKNSKINAGMKFTLCSNLLRNDEKLPKGVITGIGAVESSYLIQTVPSINSFSNADYPAVLTLVNYFSQCEGPLFRDVRGKGLAYGVDIHMSVVEGLMSLVIFKSVKAVEAYAKTAEIVSKHISGESAWNESLLESAKSSLTFALIQKERTVSKVSHESMLAYIKGVDVTYNRKLMKAVWAVTIDDLKKVAPNYLKPLFDPKVSKCVICCNPSKVAQFVEGMKKFGRQLEVIDLEKPNFLDADLLK
ncbi:hypothetical protein B4U80_11389 [Leptotrombidium deliense]|uniref:Presequence protease, mitochondrial n=1 Tax=Leptotrombidium deliense TaxID=299467 RepID=A0A443SH86_9ACAR|nr:hypothetical protein B4U80_11389 [Leptotrombidium deliense]